jgi:UDP-N-acetylglucosamine 1-carboxyvinyltransferase
MLTPKETHQVLPDRIEAGSFLILGALAGSSVEVTGLIPEHLESLLELFERAGVALEVKKDSIVVTGKEIIEPGRYRAVSLRTHEYPGFPTDLQAPMVVFLTQAQGESLVNETIFEGRLAYTEDLVKMGASIQLWNPQQASIKGGTRLTGRELFGPDIRAGLAYLFAAIVAEGESVINNVYHIDRGYASIEHRLAKLGVPIKRI